MLSIFCFFLLLLLCLACMKMSRKVVIRYIALGIFSLLIVESIIYGYFLLLILRGTCFFLIGNQTVLDALIKMRLSHAVYFAQGKKYFINQADNTTGYTLGQNKDTGIYQTNYSGFRADHEYPLVPSTDVLRLAAFGDSFVFCDEEKNSDTWSYYLEHSASNLEVLNFGVPGYGLGQSYLRYLREGLKFSPDIIFFNYIMAGNRDQIDPQSFVGDNNLRRADFYRVQFWIDHDILMSEAVTPYRLFDPSFRQTQLYRPLGIAREPSFWSWKILSISNTGLFIKQFLVKRFIAKHINSLDMADWGEQITVKILQNILTIAERNKSMVLFFPGVPFESLPRRIQTLLKKYEDMVLYVNSAEALRSSFSLHGVEGENYLNRTNHFNPRGNQLYAEAVLEILKSRTWGQEERVFSFDKKSNSFRNIKIK